MLYGRSQQRISSLVESKQTPSIIDIATGVSPNKSATTLAQIPIRYRLQCSSLFVVFVLYLVVKLSHFITCLCFTFHLGHHSPTTVVLSPYNFDDLVLMIRLKYHQLR